MCVILTSNICNVGKKSKFIKTAEHDACCDLDEKCPHRLIIWKLDPHLVVMFGNILEFLGYEILLKELYQWGQAERPSNFVLQIPVHPLSLLCVAET